MLEDLKQRVIDVAIAAEESGLCIHKSGNFSIVDREKGLIVISPSGMERKSLEVDDIPVLSLDGNIVEAGKRGKPSQEYPMHLKAYNVRDDILSVIHTHSPYATAFAIQGKPIKPVVFEALQYGLDTAIATFGRSGTQALADSIAEPLTHADVCLLKSHGVFVVGGEIEATLLKAHYVEDVAKVYLLTLNMGIGEPEEIPREEFEMYLEEMD